MKKTEVFQRGIFKVTRETETDINSIASVGEIGDLDAVIQWFNSVEKMAVPVLKRAGLPTKDGLYRKLDDGKLEWLGDYGTGDIDDEKWRKGGYHWSVTIDVDPVSREGLAYAALKKVRYFRRFSMAESNPLNMARKLIEATQAVHMLWMDLNSFSEAVLAYQRQLNVLAAGREAAQKAAKRRQEIVIRLANDGRTRTRERTVNGILNTIFDAVQKELMQYSEHVGRRTIWSDIDSLRKRGIIKN